MKKVLALFSVLVLLPLAAASGAIEVSPSSQTACCEKVQYQVTIKNSLSVQTSYELAAETESGVEVTLQPSVVVIPPKGEERLTMIIKPTCGLPPGDYKITVISTSKGWCDSKCGALCDYESGRARTVLAIPDGCKIMLVMPKTANPQEPLTEGPRSENKTPAAGSRQTLTGAAVTSRKTVLNLTPAIIIGALLALAVLMLFILKRPQKKGNYLFPEVDNQAKRKLDN
jgi:hypothetical protein